MPTLTLLHSPPMSYTRAEIKTALARAAAYIERLPEGVEWFLCTHSEGTACLGVQFDVRAYDRETMMELGTLFNRMPRHGTELERALGALKIEAYILEEDK